MMTYDYVTGKLDWNTSPTGYKGVSRESKEIEGMQVIGEKPKKLDEPKYVKKSKFDELGELIASIEGEDSMPDSEVNGEGKRRRRQRTSKEGDEEEEENEPEETAGGRRMPRRKTVPARGGRTTGSRPTKLMQDRVRDDIDQLHLKFAAAEAKGLTLPKRTRARP